MTAPPTSADEMNVFFHPQGYNVNVNAYTVGGQIFVTSFLHRVCWPDAVIFVKIKRAGQPGFLKKNWWKRALLRKRGQPHRHGGG